MDDAMAKRLVMVAEENGLDMRLYPKYSGRFMYGVTTSAVVCDTYAILAEVLVLVCRETKDSPHAFLTSLRSDNFGKGWIYY